MSQAIAHFAFGAGMTALMIAYLTPHVELPRLLIIFGGGWALLPDVNKLTDHAAAGAFHSSRWADLFWLHYTFDVYLDPGDSWVFAAGMIAFFLVSIMIYEYRATSAKGPVVSVVPQRMIEAFAWASLETYFGTTQTEEQHR